MTIPVWMLAADGLWVVERLKEVGLKGSFGERGNKVRLA